MANICHNKQSFCDLAKVPLWNIFLKEWSSIKIIDWYINPNEKGNKIKSTKFNFDAHHQPLLSGVMCVFRYLGNEIYHQRRKRLLYYFQNWFEKLSRMVLRLERALELRRKSKNSLAFLPPSADFQWNSHKFYCCGFEFYKC